MGRPDRLARIEELLLSAEAVGMAELQRELGVSRETVRKDLDALAAQGRIARTRGAAVRRTADAERAYTERRAELTAQKRAIAAAAVALLPARGAVWLDYGTTTLAVADTVVPPGPTVVTSAFPIAAALAARGVEVLVPGGSLRPGELSLSGPMAVRGVATLNLDVGFFGCAGLDPEAGLTNHHMAEAATSQAAADRCARVVVVADHTKLGHRALHRSVAPSRVHVLVTDAGADPALLARFAEAGTQVVIAP